MSSWNWEMSTWNCETEKLVIDLLPSSAISAISGRWTWKGWHKSKLKQEVPRSLNRSPDLSISKLNLSYHFYPAYKFSSKSDQVEVDGKMAAILKMADNKIFWHQNWTRHTTITVYTKFQQNQSKFNYLAGLIISLCFQDFNDKNRIALPILKILGQMVDHL